MFTHNGKAAKQRVCAITGEDPKHDPFDGNPYSAWKPTGTRIGFHQRIRQYIMDNAPREMGPTLDGELWITCAYCNWEYPESRIEVDHYVNWADYSMQMNTTYSLQGASAWEVYIGCNDPANLVASCKKCNGSKGNRTATQQWIQQRRNLANQNNGF